MATPDNQPVRRMTPSQVISRVLAALILVVVVVSIALSFFNSQAISSITVTALHEGKEPRDATLMGVGKEQSLPDYRLEVIDRNDAAFDLGTIPNQSAVAGLTWKCKETIPRHIAVAVRLIDADPLEPDIVEKVAITEPTMASDNYRYQVHYTRSFRVGTIYFLFSTPVGWFLVGLVVLFGILLASNICVPN